MRRNRRKVSSLSWSLDSSDPLAPSNARALLALLQLVPRLPGAFPNHNHDDLGAAFAPVLGRLLPQLRKAVWIHCTTVPEAVGQVDSDAEELHQVHGAHILIGQALSLRYPAFRALFATLEARLARFVDRHPHPCDANIEILARLLRLEEAETEVLQLAAALSHGTIERSLFSFANSLTRLTKALEVLCGVRGSAALHLFDAHRALARSGLLEPWGDSRSSRELEQLLTLSPVGERLLGTPMSSAAEMAQVVLTPLAAPSPDTLRLEWPHLAQAQALLAAALSEALERGARGVNVLLHGAPGTGKTEYASALLAAIGAAGFAVNSTDHEGSEASRRDRLHSLRMAQTFADQRERAVLVLDEAEDIFQSDYQSPLARVFNAAHESKSWTNQLLESNPHPVIWISNQVAHLDPAYLRRFTFCLEFPRTPHALRKRIAQQRLTEIGCNASTIDAVAADERMTPALLSSAARFATMSAASGLGPDLAVRTLVEQHQRAAGNSAPPPLARRLTRFDLNYLNVEGNATPQRVLDALRKAAVQPTALVFSGAPGTGKTQFAAELAERLGRQLVLRTASDINSMWYGESERNVARMFRECDPKSELLFLDEAEVLLGARGGAGHRADRAVTAEFLRWLESFAGVFICATNHPDDFDAALLRRFAFRLEFKALTRAQREAMYAELVHGRLPGAAADAPALADDIALRLARLELLTAGDFANTARRVAQLGLGAEAWLDELEAEHRAKPQARAAALRFGFI